MRDVLAPGDPGQDRALVLVQVGRDQGEHGGANHLRGRVPEDPLGGGVPGQDGAVERLADDGLVRGFDDCGEPRRRERNLVGTWRCGVRISQTEPPDRVG
jgi:hypothetical protein